MAKLPGVTRISDCCWSVKNSPLKAKPCFTLKRSPSATSRHSPAIPKLPQIGLNRRIQPCRFLLLLAPLGTESLHLFLKWFVVVFLLCCTDVATRREHMAVLADF